MLEVYLIKWCQLWERFPGWDHVLKQFRDNTGPYTLLHTSEVPRLADFHRIWMHTKAAYDVVFQTGLIQVCLGREIQVLCVVLSKTGMNLSFTSLANLLNWGWMGGRLRCTDWKWGVIHGSMGVCKWQCMSWASVIFFPLNCTRPFLHEIG